MTDAEIERYTDRGHRRLLAHLDDGLVHERARGIRSTRAESVAPDGPENPYNE